jgi:hypothetical protein
VFGGIVTWRDDGEQRQRTIGRTWRSAEDRAERSIFRNAGPIETIMNRSPRLRAVAATSVACAGLFVGLAVPAGAATRPLGATGSAGAARLATVQSLAKVAISNRLTALNETVPLVTANKIITDADRTTLLSTLNSDVSGLTTLGQTITADTVAEQARTDYQTIFTSYRVYALALPQVRYAAAVDDITSTVVPDLTNAQTTLAGLLAGADAAKNTAAVQASMSDLSKQISAITSATNGLSSTVLADTPAQYDANHALLSQPRATLGQARADIATSRADIADVVKALQ